MRNRTNPIRTLRVPPVKPRNQVVMAVVQRLGTLLGGRHANDRRARARFERMDLDQRVREIGEW